MNAYLFPALGSTIDLLEHHFNHLSEAKWDIPTHPDRFTPREVLAHLADWEPILAERMKQAVANPGSTIQPYDEGQMAIDNDYASADPTKALSDFRTNRQQNIEWLQSISDDQWAMTIVHPERGTLSVYDIANMMACHDIYHIKQLMEA